MTINSLCIHGHFYQPPREDPLTGIIPSEPGASPFRNWNERIHAECYRPNAQLGNFKQISFNIGPTLFSWMAAHDRVTYQQIIDQDRANVNRFGAGNAIAQAYNHTILPLATSSDKVIQVYWGIADFIHRFRRKPQGMWLPETAVDNETLAVLANQGIEFTILAPWQAADNNIDITEPYLVRLPGGRRITVFFYERDLSGRISFDPSATENADRFAEKDLYPLYHNEKGKRSHPQMVVLASDGELYGHHKPLRERFLSHLLDGASTQRGITPTYPALWLKHYPPMQAISIREHTSWSCHHGITRWMDECACSSLDGKWKSHLRTALDHLGAALDLLYIETVYPLIPKPRILRQRYIHAILGEISTQDLVNEMAGKALTTDQILRIQLLLESQKERQRMFTSCGWFFDDFDRIEPKNNLAYAAQAVRLARLATGEDLAPLAISDLKQVVSPRTGHRADLAFNYHLNRTWIWKPA
jgi:alpha-amylase/alpha-mannosidase (GH57 family)